LFGARRRVIVTKVVRHLPKLRTLGQQRPHIATGHGRLAVGLPPIIDGQRAPTLAQYADPLPQALVLTAIVISFAMTAVLLVIAVRARAATGTDHADGTEPAPIDGAPLTVTEERAP